MGRGVGFKNLHWIPSNTLSANRMPPSLSLELAECLLSRARLPPIPRCDRVVFIGYLSQLGARHSTPIDLGMERSPQ